MGRFLPAKIGDITLGFLSRISTQLAARKLARRLVAEHSIDVVHQPIPVSPREPSLLFGLGAPVVMGPLNGNMSFPPAFRSDSGSRAVNIAVQFGRACSPWLHLLLPGKLQAAFLLVANERTRAALPKAARGRVVELVENGVDLEVWKSAPPRVVTGQPVHVIFIGRLVDWKAVDLLLEAVSRLHQSFPLRVDILGDGPMRKELEGQVEALGISQSIFFEGWQSQDQCAARLAEADILVLPSLYECGGAVVLEAMACGVPVIATDWGGPAEYLDEHCGIRVPVSSREAVIAGLAAAVERLGADPALRRKMGAAGRRRVASEYDWEVKIDRMLQIYALCKANA